MHLALDEFQVGDLHLAAARSTDGWIAAQQIARRGEGGSSVSVAATMTRQPWTDACVAVSHQPAEQSRGWDPAGQFRSGRPRNAAVDWSTPWQPAAIPEPRWRATMPHSAPMRQPDRCIRRRAGKMRLRNTSPYHPNQRVRLTGNANRRARLAAGRPLRATPRWCTIGSSRDLRLAAREATLSASCSRRSASDRRALAANPAMSTRK